MTDEERTRIRRGRKPATESDKAFPRVFRAMTDARDVTQASISQALGVNGTYVSHLATGLKTPKPETIDRLAEALSLDEGETRRLHTAAAVDLGFRLDLPDDF